MNESGHPGAGQGSTSDALDALCRAAGIVPGYSDVWGATHTAPDATRRTLLQAMGILEPTAPGRRDNEDSTPLEKALGQHEAQAWRRATPPVAVYREEALPYRLLLRFPEAAAGETHAWRLVLETGDTRQGEFRPTQLERLEAREIEGARYLQVAFDWHERLPLGYHRFIVQPREKAGSESATTVVIAPQRCYLPPALREGGRAWGAAAQLYGVRSARNWGMGDYTDLATIVEQWSRRGAGIVGVNPLHALYPHNPAHASPYSPASRRFLNVLYLDVEALPDMRECREARTKVRSSAFRARVKAAKSGELIDYRAIAALKLEVLEVLYAHFRLHHLRAETEGARAFREFQAAGGEALRRHALFEALQQHFHDADPAVWGFPVWPEAYRDPRSEAVARYAQAHVERIEFYEYLQWHADAQLGWAAEHARETGMEIGLYTDIAVSVDSGGAEAWANQDSYVHGATLGAPPDEINLQGQNWGLPPLHPERLRAAAYEPFIAILRANMRHAGAVRIDHVMGLARLFWIPRGRSAADGAYVRYPFEDLLGVLALESERNRCMVIGEDLGTVPDEVRAGLERCGVLSYRLLYFERTPENDFVPSTAYPANALVAASTHDLPTLAGYWEGRDLQLRQSLGLFPSDAVREAQIVARAQDRARLALALEREGLLPPGTLNPVSPQQLTAEAARVVQLYMARTPARVLVVQLEDVLGLHEQANVPGTTDEHPNWRRRLPVELERIPDDPRFTALAGKLAAERPRARVAGKPRVPPAARIPRATYRLQLSKAYTFADATALVPYLAGLGVSHVYCSPYLRARPGSTHGYDIIDHGALNPEIGSREDFERFVAALRAHGMGHILDMVPNHVGVMGSDNGWWLDVLEDGPASAHAHFFDIEWWPPSTDLANKILLPVLGDHYGAVLERGELELRFEAAGGSFSVWYHEHRLPIDPRDYAPLLELAMAAIDLGAVPESVLTELATLGAAAGRLPPRSERAQEQALERRRGKEAVKQRLARLAAEGGAVAQALDSAARAYSGAAGRESLHELLERQAYRLAHWRVASDEINYRRFFDVNDLAALRMEDETVFDATHRLVLGLAADGKLDGLRIDHPDGLYDPAGYFERLQGRHAQLCGFEFPADPERRTLPLYVVVEKIAAGHEHLPGWAVHGTTGYRFAAVVNGLFVDGDAREEMDRIYRSFVPDAVPFHEEAYQGRRAMLRTALASALTMLSTELLRIARADRNTRDYSFIMLRQALADVIACFPVYRTYIAGGKPSEQDRRYIDWAVARARRRSRAADVTIFDFVRRALLAETPPDASAGLAALTRDFAMKFQQLTAPVAAKGVEDTAFYRYNRLVSLNDVGADPELFGFPVSAFHGASAERAAHWPHTMLATSTHDNKRAEDVRARINVISEVPAEWQALVQRWSRMNRSRKRAVEDEPAPSPNDEYLLYQTLIGTFPQADVSGEALAAYRDRIRDYMIKAVREAKAQSSWTAPNEEYEGAVTAFVEAILAEGDSNRFLVDLRAQHVRFAWFGWLNSLSMTLVKHASPGVPDIYQGTELPDLSLVDPDNRRPVDYELRGRLLRELAELAAGPRVAQAVRELAARMADGRARLWLIWRALQLRAEHPGLFANGDYVALEASGARAVNVVAFARRHDGYGLIAVAGRLWAGLGAGVGELPLGRKAWQDTAVDLAPLGEIEEPVDIITMQPVGVAGGRLVLADALADFPGALIFCRLAG